MRKKVQQPKLMSALLQSSTGTLAQIAEKTNFLLQLDDIVRQICPDLPADAWKIGNFREETVVIEVKSAVWGQRFQFERNTIARELASISNNQLTKIDIKVSPFKAVTSSSTALDTKTQKHPKRCKMSAQTAEQFKAMAESAPTGLREKLLNLAKLAENQR